MATLDSGLSLYIVHITDRKIEADDDAHTEYAVRARSTGEAKLRAILRHDTDEANLDDYDFTVFLVGPVSEVAEDAE